MDETELESRPAGAAPANPQLMRAMNERLLLEHVRQSGPISRADLARLSGLSKPTVGVALANLERDGLLRPAGLRRGVRGPAALLYEVRPEAGFILGLDLGRGHLRGAVSDLSGTVLARSSRPFRPEDGHLDVAISLADELAVAAGIERSQLNQVVVATPGVYDPTSRLIQLAPDFPGSDSPGLIEGLRHSLGPSTSIENDLDLAALAERDFGHGQEFKTFCYVWVDDSVGMGLVINGELHRGAHGAAGEIAYLPIVSPRPQDGEQAEARGHLEAAASAAAVLRSARQSGLGGPLSVRRIFASAAAGDDTAKAVVAEEAMLVARAIGSIVTVVDPELVVLGGDIGRADGFPEAVTAALASLVPVVPELRVSALDEGAVVAGCLAAGKEMAWRRLLGDI